MTILSLLLLVIGVVVIGWLAHWVITTFFQEPIRMIALCVVGVLLLCALLYAFFPGAANHRVW